MACAKLQEYLEEKRVRFVSIKHSPAFTAQEIAAAAHIPGKEVAKTVVVKLDGVMAMVVLPAPEMTTGPTGALSSDSRKKDPVHWACCGHVKTGFGEFSLTNHFHNRSRC